MNGSPTPETVAAWVRRQLVTYAPSLEKEMLALPALVRPGDVCFDVGASFGTYTVVLARLVRLGGRVHAGEPRPRSLRVLALVNRLLTDGNVEVHPIALSDRADQEVIVTPRRRWFLPVPGRTFLKGSLEAGPQGYYPGWGEEFGGAAERVVMTQTLDGLVADNDIDRIDFVKVDVEGAELRVLVGAEATLVGHRPILLCEIEDRHTRKYGHGADDVFEWLRSRGYHAHVFDRRGLREVDGLLPGENNYLFLPGDGGRSCSSSCH
ncbi:MAG: FkbM family methyltransferase [Actinomycetota bacterium]|nr:FkbM family methyltransferase [Actinomycetota bacterium]